LTVKRARIADINRPLKVGSQTPKQVRLTANGYADKLLLSSISSADSVAIKLQPALSLGGLRMQRLALNWPK
jgi:hypothetical protein